MNKNVRVAAVFAVLAGLLFTGACKKKAAAPAQPVQPVNAVKVIKADLPWNIEYPAQVVGSLQINIRAQVGGILESRLYNEGEYVQEGTQLFQINDKEYKVALEKAQGTLAQAVADEKRTKRDYNRMQKLRADNAISQKDYDDALSAYEAAQANLQVAKAGVSNAEINLGYTKVTAPISGIAGKEAQSVGSLISPAGETGLLTTMVQINPLWANFSMPSRQFEKLASGYMSGQIVLGDGVNPDKVNPGVYRETPADQAPIYVEAVLANGKLYPQKGKIIFFDSTENAQTSSLAIKAEFPNPRNSRLLMPGQFVRVRLIGATYKDAVLIPSSAALNTPQGLLVYVVDDNNTLSARPIQAELQDGMYIVTDGLKGGETVVYNGLIKVKPGMQVKTEMKEFKLPESLTQPSAAQAASVDGRSVAELEKVIDSAEQPDAQTLPDAQQNQTVAPVALPDVAATVEVK